MPRNKPTSSSGSTKRSGAGRRPPAPTGCSVVVCQGCCCARDATGRQDPDALARPQRIAEHVASQGGRVTVSDCLGPCAHRDVVVIRPSPEGRAEGAKPVWLGFAGDDETYHLIGQWVHDGGPGVADMPGLLDLNLFTPASRHRKAL